MNTVAAFVSSSTPEQLPGAQNPSSQEFMSNQERAGLCQPGSCSQTGTLASVPREPGRHAPAHSEGREALCKQLTGLSIQETSISVGKYLNIYWHSILEVDPLLRAALLPIKNCTPNRLKQCMDALIQRYPDPRGMHRWVNLLMRQLVPVLDWKIVLAYARFNDPAIAEQAISPLPGTPGI